MHLPLRVFLTAGVDHLWVCLPDDPPGWWPAAAAFARIPPAHLACDVLVTRRPGALQGHVWIEELATGYAWRQSHPAPEPPPSPSMTVRWRSWLRDNPR